MGNCIGASMMIKHLTQFKKHNDSEYLNTHDQNQSDQEYSNNSIQLTNYCSIDKNNREYTEL